ncbi:MAG: hypothetical protein CMJ83_13535, partial [Planctomycetes bacterium]|nr:hypothetical protein [Planctomycetota bacterium]
PDAWYPTVQRAMQDLLPSAYDIWFADEQHPRVRRWRYSFANLARRCALWATEVGELQFSIPLREFLATVTEGHVKNHARALAILALDRIARLDIVTATRELDEAIPHLPANSVLGAVARAARARCRLLKGDPGQALKDVNRAWSQLSRDSRGGNLLAQHAQPDSRDYWMLVDLLMMRYELVRKHDRGLESQARRDLERAIDPSLVFGIRRVPALAFRGRLHHLVGDDDKARPLLLEMRKIAPKTLLERGGGPNGRMDVPTWRLIGLRTLQDVLDPTTDAALLEEIDAEVRALRPL